LTTVEVAGDLTQPLATGALKPATIVDLGEVARGEKPKRKTKGEVTWFKSGGGGHEDLATAWAIYQARMVGKR
jgi:ornithine cyclodeaminase/alanine dehydrogenase-like protein (mu-crystallin family)